MNTLILDTNIVSYHMKGHRIFRRYQPRLEGHTLAISFMTVAELYEGAFRDNWSERKLLKLREALRNYVVLPSSAEVCIRWGKIRSDRRRQPISVDDAWIAATAAAHGCPLVTHNPRDFRGIDGLEVLSVDGNG